MTQSAIFASLSVFLYFIGFIPYIYHVFHGRVVPHPFSWTIWFIFSATNCAILLTVNGFSWSLASLVMRTGALLIGLACGWWFIRKIHISKFDYLSLILALFVIVCINLYGMKQAVIAMIVVDLIVLLPTVKKIWHDPRTEDAFAWLTTAFSQSCLLISLPFFTFENSFFWFYAICVNLSVGLFIHLRFAHKSKTIIWRIEKVFSTLKQKFVIIFLALKNKV